MQLVLVRHGLPVRSSDSSDPPLAAEGVEQARRVARWLARERCDAVFSSTMKRAIQTAEPFAALVERPVQTHAGIVEFDRDSGTYVPMEELKRDDYEAWKAFVAGNHGADIDSFQTAVVATLEEIVNTHSGKTVAVFCHGGVINVWTAYVLGMPARLFFEPAYASLHRYLCARSGERNLVGLNDVGHLRD